MDFPLILFKERIPSVLPVCFPPGLCIIGFSRGFSVSFPPGLISYEILRGFLGNFPLGLFIMERILCTKGVFCSQSWDQERTWCSKGVFCAQSCFWLRDLERGSADFWVQKKGKLDISHRYNRIPLLPSGPGGVLQELVVYDLPGHKGRNFFIIPKLYSKTAERKRQDGIYRFHYLYFAGRAYDR